MSLLLILELEAKIKRRDKHIQELEQAQKGFPTNLQIKAGMMAVLDCSASDLKDISQSLFEMYKNELTIVYGAMNSQLILKR